MITNPKNDDWQLAPCRTIDPELWFLDSIDTRQVDPDTITGLTLALETCNGCPLQTACLELGMQGEDLHYGIWGGLLVGERYQLARMDRYQHQRRAITRARQIRHLTKVPMP